MVAKIDGDLIPFATGWYVNKRALDRGVQATLVGKGTVHGLDWTFRQKIGPTHVPRYGAIYF